MSVIVEAAFYKVVRRPDTPTGDSDTYATKTPGAEFCDHLLLSFQHEWVAARVLIIQKRNKQKVYTRILKKVYLKFWLWHPYIKKKQWINRDAPAFWLCFVWLWGWSTL